MDLHNSGVLQPRDSLGLGLKTLQLLRPRVTASEDHLESDDAVQLEVLRFIDDAHATASQFAQDFIIGRGEERWLQSRDDRA